MNGSFTARAATAGQSLFQGRWLLIAITAAVTWLAVIGAALGVSLIRNGNTSTPMPGHQSGAVVSWAIYELQWPVPTTFGSLAVTAADMTLGDPEEAQLRDADAEQRLVDPDKVLVQLSLNLSNERGTVVDAPRVQDFRLVSTYDGVADLVPSLTTLPDELSAESTTSASLAYLAPRQGAVLWLEYTVRPGERPVRVAVGWPDRPAPEPLEPAPRAPLGDAFEAAPDSTSNGG